MSDFEEDSVRGAEGLGHRAIMECRLCWTPYDPALGDDFRRIDPGTPFSGLPDDWNCPTCAAPKDEFKLKLVPTTPEHDAEMAQRPVVDPRVDRLVRDFRVVSHTTMRDAPMVNSALKVQAVGFRELDKQLVGVLIGPWFMNLIVLPAEDVDWSNLSPGEKEFIALPSGEYEFVHNWRELCGGYKACALFSPMEDFSSQEQAVAVAETVMKALFETDLAGSDDLSAIGPDGEDEPADIFAQAEDRTDKKKVKRTGAGNSVGLPSAVSSGPGKKT